MALSNETTPTGKPLIEWNDPKDFPDILNAAQNRFSVDVLVYCAKSDEHTIGWFDFNTMEWLFLCREANFADKWKWRYLTDEYDRFNPIREQIKKEKLIECKY